MPVPPAGAVPTAIPGSMIRTSVSGSPGRPFPLWCPIPASGTHSGDLLYPRIPPRIPRRRSRPPRRPSTPPRTPSPSSPTGPDSPPSAPCRVPRYRSQSDARPSRISSSSCSRRFLVRITRWSLYVTDRRSGESLDDHNPYTTCVDSTECRRTPGGKSGRVQLPNRVTIAVTLRDRGPPGRRRSEGSAAAWLRMTGGRQGNGHGARSERELDSLHEHLEWACSDRSC